MHGIARIDALLSLFGGMGSFNDLMFVPMNYPSADPSQLDKVEEELPPLVDAIYREVADRARRENQVASKRHFLDAAGKWVGYVKDSDG